MNIRRSHFILTILLSVPFYFVDAGKIVSPTSTEAAETKDEGEVRSHHIHWGFWYDLYCKTIAKYIIPCEEEEDPSCIGLLQAECNRQTTPDGICFWGVCDSDSGSDCNAEDVVKCYIQLQSGDACSDITDQNQCENSFQPSNNDYQCIWESGSCKDENDCTYCEIDPALATADNLNRKLFALLEGEELQEQQSLYEEEEEQQLRVSLCDDPNSIHYGKVMPSQECKSHGNQVSNNQENNQFMKEKDGFVPWASPSASDSNTLALNPGIWSIDNFLNEEEIDTFLALTEKYGRDLDMYGPCRHEEDRQNAHPNEGKECFKISAENVCEGPYALSKCDTKTKQEDADFISLLMEKVKSIWSTKIEPHPYLKINLTTEGGIMRLHYDKRSIAFIIYLTNGGASTIFPNANVTISPKMGTAYTWLNYDEYGNRNPMADHAVQAHPKDAGNRLMVSIEFRTPSKEFADSQAEL